MPPVSPPSEHPELFRSALVNLVDRRHPLLRLAGLAQLLRQRRDDRGREKIHALHAPEVECIVGPHPRFFETRMGTRARARPAPASSSA